MSFYYKSAQKVFGFVQCRECQPHTDWRNPCAQKFKHSNMSSRCAQNVSHTKSLFELIHSGSVPQQSVPSRWFRAFSHTNVSHSKVILLYVCSTLAAAFFLQLMCSERWPQQYLKPPLHVQYAHQCKMNEVFFQESNS